MIDSTLKFKSAAEAHAALTLIGWGEEGSSDPDIILDIIGEHCICSGTPEEPVFIKQPGYYVNVRVLRGADVSVLSKYVVNVNPPIRVWA